MSSKLGTRLLDRLLSHYKNCILGHLEATRLLKKEKTKQT